MVILSVIRDPREGEAADGKEKDFLVVLKSLTPKEICRPWGFWGREVKDELEQSQFGGKKKRIPRKYYDSGNRYESRNMNR